QIWSRFVREPNSKSGARPVLLHGSLYRLFQRVWKGIVRVTSSRGIVGDASTCLRFQLLARREMYCERQLLQGARPVFAWEEFGYRPDASNPNRLGDVAADRIARHGVTKTPILLQLGNDRS